MVIVGRKEKEGISINVRRRSTVIKCSSTTNCNREESRVVEIGGQASLSVEDSMA